MYKLLTLAMVGLAVLYGNFVHSKPLINGTWICDLELADMPDFEGQFSGSYFDDRGFDLVLDGQYDLNGHPIIANIHFMGEWWIENDRLMRQAKKNIKIGGCGKTKCFARPEPKDMRRPSTHRKEWLN